MDVLSAYRLARFGKMIRPKTLKLSGIKVS
jgi:hypothetical protein